MVMDAKICNEPRSVAVFSSLRGRAYFRETNERVRTDLGPDIDRSRDRLFKQSG